MKLKTAKIVIAFVIIIPIIVILGWIFNIEIFKTGFPGSHSTMKFNTAFCFLLAGISLALLQKERLSPSKWLLWQILTSTLIIIPTLTLIQYIFGWQLGIDQLIFIDINPSKTTIYPGRMGEITALNFILVGIALLLLRKKRPYRQWLAQILAITMMLIVIMPLLSNLLGVNTAYQLVKHIASTAIHTAINFIFLGIGILLTSKYGLMNLITSDMIGGEMIRRLLPWAIAVPLILNGLILYGHKLNLYDDSSSYAYFSVINISLLWALIYWNALKLNQIEEEKIAKLQEFNQSLENRVLARTIELEQVNNQLLFALQYRQEQAQLIIEKEALLTSVLETTKDLFLAVDKNFNIIAFNHNYYREFKQNTGIDIEIGMNFMEALSVIPEDKKRVTPLWEKALQGQKFSILYNFHSPTIKKDYFFEFDFNPMWDKNGDLSGVSQFARDVTERVINERKLQESEAKLQAIIDSAPAAIYAKDSQGKFILINRYFLDLFNWNKEDCLGKSFSELVPGESIKKVENDDQQVWSSQTHLYLEEQISISDEIHIYHTIKFLLYDFHGNPYALCGISTDITERKKAEIKLKESESTLAEAQKIAHLGNWSFDVLTGKLSWSEETFRIYGFEEQKPEPTYEQFLKIIHPDDLNNFTNNVTLAIQEGRTYDYEFRIFKPDNSLVYIFSKRQVIYDKTGKIVQLFGVIQDITERKKIELQLMEAKQKAELANQAKSQFLANMSHEIRTPMNAILGFSELLRTMITDNQQLSYLETIISSGKALLALINDILDLSKIEAGQLDINYQPMLIIPLIEEIKQIFHHQAIMKGILFFTEIAPDVPEQIIFDAIRLRQILFNVVANGIKFTEQGEVKLSILAHVNPPNNNDNLKTITLEISVTDTGIGIIPEQQEQIFEAFFQSDGKNTRKYGGTGLGLAITKRLTGMLGGTIELISELGEGSKFTFIFPHIQIIEVISQLTMTSFPENITQIVAEKPTVNQAYQLQNLPELLAKLRQEKDMIWTELCLKMKRRDLQNFAQRLYDLGEEYQEQFLINYSQNLSKALADFDYEKLEQTLKNFAEIVITVEEIVNNIGLTQKPGF